MDAFFASIEQAINPRLKGKPLIVGSRNSPRFTVVCAASYEAKALGITSGMRSQDAFRICPNLSFVPAQQDRYIWTSRQIFTFLKGLGYPIQYCSIDEFTLDIGDTQNCHKLSSGIQEKITQDFGITASIGIGKNYLLAKLASKLKKPAGFLEINEENLEDILKGVPAKKICGVGEATNLLLENLGINTCLDLYQKDVLFLKEYLGQYGINLYFGLHTKEEISISEHEDLPKSIGHSYTLSKPNQNPGFISAWFRLLSEKVAERLRAQDLLAKTVHLWLELPEFGHFSRQKSFSNATDDGALIATRAMEIMAKNGLIWPNIRAIGVTCSGLILKEYEPLFLEDKKRNNLLKAVDRINQRFGEEAIFPAVIKLTNPTTGTL